MEAGGLQDGREDCADLQRVYKLIYRKSQPRPREEVQEEEIKVGRKLKHATRNTVQYQDQIDIVLR